MLYDINDQVKSNIFVFLDRVKYDGLKEIQAISEIITALSNPVKNNEENYFIRNEVD